MIRDAKAVDIISIIALLHVAFEKSHYSASGLCQIDVVETKRLLLNAIARHGGSNGGSCFLQVAENDGRITGMILGNLQRVYAIGNRLLATDVFWISLDDGGPLDGVLLMRNMISWAWSSPAVVEIRCGATAAIGGDPSRAGGILKTLGMTEYAHMFRMERKSCLASSTA